LNLCTAGRGGSTLWSGKEVMFGHHYLEYFSCLPICIWFYVLVSISSRNGSHPHTQNPSSGGDFFLFQIKKKYFSRICIVPLCGCMFRSVVRVSFHFCFRVTRTRNHSFQGFWRHWFGVKLGTHGIMVFFRIGGVSGFIDFCVFFYVLSGLPICSVERVFMMDHFCIPLSLFIFPEVNCPFSYIASPRSLIFFIYVDKP